MTIVKKHEVHVAHETQLDLFDLLDEEHSGQVKEPPEDIWGRAIDRYVWTRTRVTLSGVLRGSEIGLRRKGVTRIARERVARHLRRWGWQSSQSTNSRYYERPVAIPTEKAEFTGNMPTIMEVAGLEHLCPKPKKAKG